MPAVTVDDILTLPRLREPDPAAATAAPGAVGDHRAARASRARASRSAARSPASTCAALDPFIHMDQMGEVEYAPGEPKGTPWHPHRGFETVTYMIDGDVRAPGLQRRRRRDHQRRHPVDDRRRRAPAHRDPARAAGRQRRPVPRHPALGQPAAQATSGRRRATRTSAAARSRCCPPPTAARWSGSSPASSTGTPGPGVTYTPITLLHATVSPRRDADAAVAAGLQRAGLRAGRQRARSAPSGARCGPGQLAVLGAGDVAHRRAPTPSRTAARPSWTCCCSAAGRSASRSPRTARSS